MPISGLIITLADDAPARRKALVALATHSAIELGEIDDNRLPIVVDTPDNDADRAVWQWLHEQPGITFVDLAYAHFEHDPDADSFRSPWHARNWHQSGARRCSQDACERGTTK